MSDTTHVQRKVYFEIVLKKDWLKDSWPPGVYQDYTATVRLYNKYHNGRTYEQFLLDMLGGKKR